MEQIINNLVISINSIGRGFCNYACNMFVQSSVLIVLLLIIDFLLRRHVRAVFRYFLWMLVFIKLILPPTLSLQTGIGYWCGGILPTERFASKSASNMSAAKPVKPVTSEDFVINTEFPQAQPSRSFSETVGPVASTASNLPSVTWQATVFLIWLIGVLVFSVLLIQRMFFVRALLLQSKSAKGRLSDMLNQYRQQVGVRRNIELKLSNHLQSPAVCGLFRPAILMPTSLLEKLSRDKLRAVLIHELAHIKRGDLWVNLIQTVLQIIYFYNPFVWLANLIVRRIREQAVDEAVLVTLGNEAKSYSNTLIDIAEMVFWKTNLSLRLIGVAESKNALKRRIKHMLTRPIPKSAKISFLGLLTVIILASILLPMAAAATKDNKNDEPQFTAALPNGVTVELVGICEYPSQGKQWWRPDGSRLDMRIITEDKSRYNSKYPGYEIAFEADGQDFDFIRGSIGGSEQSSGLDVIEPKEIFAYRVHIKPGINKTKIKAGAATGKWSTVATHNGHGTTFRTVKGKKIIFSAANESKDGLVMTISDNMIDDNNAIRLIVIDKSGFEHKGQVQTSLSVNQMRQQTFAFPKVFLKDIQEFQFQIRPYQWVTFKDISLKPGVKTDVQVEVEAPAVQIESERPKVISVSPASGSEMALVSELQVVFDQPMIPNQFEIVDASIDKSYEERSDVAAVRSYAVYDADKYQFSIPLMLPCNWNGSIKLSGFKSIKGVEVEPIVLNYTTLRDKFSGNLLQRFEKARQSGELRALLENIKNVRSKLKSLSEVVHTTYHYGNREESNKVVFKIKGKNQFYVDMSEEFKKPWYIGSDGEKCWFYNEYRDKKLVVIDSDQIAEKNIIICDPFEITKADIDTVIKQNNLEYLGTGMLDGRECYIVRSWRVDIEDEANCIVITLWFDSETYMLAQVVGDSGRRKVTQRFVYEKIGQPINDSEFRPEFVTQIESQEPDPLNEDYDTRYIRIIDGSSTVRMSIGWGKRGPKGTSGSGLN